MSTSTLCSCVISQHPRFLFQLSIIVLAIFHGVCSAGVFIMVASTVWAAPHLWFSIAGMRRAGYFLSWFGSFLHGWVAFESR